MKPMLLLAASALALAGVAACTPNTKPAARAALDCPSKQGDLTRTGVAGDGKSCFYTTADGAEITLQLVSTGGNAIGALETIETNLTPARAATAEETKAAKDEDVAAASADAAADAAEAAKDAADDAKVSVKVDGGHKPTVEVTTAPGVRIEERHDGDGNETTRINLPGIHIDAGEDDANVKIGGLTVTRVDDEAKIKIVRDVRLKGEAFSREKRGLRATYIYTGKNLPDGYRFVGYEAAGPKAGPLTVAIVRSKLQSEDGGEIYPDVKKLVRKNGGV